MTSKDGTVGAGRPLVAARSLLLVLVGIGIGLSLSAATSEPGGGKVLEARRVVVGSPEGGQRVILGEVDADRFGILVVDDEADVEVFLGVRDRGRSAPVAECRAVRRIAHSDAKDVAVLATDGERALIKAMRLVHGKWEHVDAQVGFEVTGHEAIISGEGPGMVDARSSLRWSSRTAAIELATWPEDGTREDGVVTRYGVEPCPGR